MNWAARVQGRIDRHTALGKFVATTSTGRGGVTALCTVGMHIWCGLDDGTVLVWEASSMLRELCMQAHDADVVAITQVRAAYLCLSERETIHGVSPSIHLRPPSLCRAHGRCCHFREFVSNASVGKVSSTCDSDMPMTPANELIDRRNPSFNGVRALST